MRKITLNFVLTILFLPLISAFAGGSYVWPLKLAPDLSSRFCDYRSGHFHAGLDIRTNSKPGYRIYAIDDGYIYRVSMAHNGYGKAIYLRLSDGRIAVYGHLSSLGDDLDEYVRLKQIKDKKYRQDLVFDPGEYKVKKGQEIGRSGSSGSGAPHLHFELRTSDNHPINPLKSGFSIADNTPPVFERLAVRYFNGKYHAGNPSLIDFPVVTGEVGEYNVADTLITDGDIALAVSGGDLIDKKKAIYGFYSLRMYVDDSLAFIMNSDSISYETTGEIDYIRDPEIQGQVAGRYRRDNDEDVFYRLYVPQGGRQFFWGSLGDDAGVISPAIPGRTRNIKIEGLDESGNKATLSLYVKSPELAPPSPDFVSYYKFADTLEVDFLTYEEISKARVQFRDFASEPFKDIESSHEATTWRRNGIVAYLNTVKIISPYNYEDYRFRFTFADGQGTPWVYFWNSIGRSGLLAYGSPEQFRIEYYPDSILTDLLIQLQSRDVAFDLAMYQQGIGIFSTDIVDRELQGPVSIRIKKGQKSIFDTTLAIYPVYPDKYTDAYSPDSSLRLRFVPGTAFHPFCVIPSNGNEIEIFGRAATAYDVRPRFTIFDSPAGYEFDLTKLGMSPENLGAYGYVENSNSWGFIARADSSKIEFLGHGLGRVALIRDDTPPVVSGIRPRGKIRSRKPELHCIIRDNMSGISLNSSLEMRIDDIWVPAEYDFDNRRFSYKVKNQLSAGKHKLYISVSDNQGNKTEKTSYFTIL